MEIFFNRNPRVVAKQLVGMKLRRGNREVEILEVVPQSVAENARWQRRPLFGANPVDFYVAPYRSALLPFVRTKTGTCVRLNRAKVGDEVIANPTGVARALGIEREATGDVTLEGQTVVVRLHPLPRPGKR